MPLYEYRCSSCGIFEASRPMAEARRAHACPSCARRAGRIMSAAHPGRGGQRRRGVPEPRLVQRPEAPPAPPRLVAPHASRPWMLGH